MAHFNQCSQLIENEQDAQKAYDVALANNQNPFELMLRMQHMLQTNLALQKPEYNKSPDALETAGDVLDWLRDQKDAIDDETRELYTALGGMSNGENQASNVWKKWRAKHGEFRNRKISEMSLEDQLEIKFEMVDIMHFVLCQLLALGIDGEELFKLYFLKNAENFKRWNVDNY